MAELSHLSIIIVTVKFWNIEVIHNIKSVALNTIGDISYESDNHIPHSYIQAY
jgi:hypothetical protein